MFPAKIGVVLVGQRFDDKHAARRRQPKRRTTKRHALPKQRQPE
jgi:hypothetical protein